MMPPNVELGRLYASINPLLKKKLFFAKVKPKLQDLGNSKNHRETGNTSPLLDVFYGVYVYIQYLSQLLLG
jgi:hypothetical protein